MVVKYYFGIKGRMKLGFEYFLIGQTKLKFILFLSIPGFIRYKVNTTDIDFLAVQAELLFALTTLKTNKNEISIYF